MMIPIVAILMPLALVPTVMAMRHATRKREWEHAERMKALELGVPVPGSDSWRAAVCMAIGAGVPVGAFAFAWIAGMTTHTSADSWEAAVAVGIPGVLCGTFLAARLLPSRNRPQITETNAFANGKPALDPDTYDVVGRRG
ncbi:MAG TPA: hypothetical protein VGZ22_14210 [Isosphaeraceae bacterium]|nr:hypothetical protein [Isosphaeraceae bacterium]